MSRILSWDLILMYIYDLLCLWGILWWEHWEKQKGKEKRRKPSHWRCFLAPRLCVLVFLGGGRGGRSKEAWGVAWKASPVGRQLGQESPEGQPCLLLFCWSRCILCGEGKRCEMKEMGAACSWWFLMMETERLQETRPVLWALLGSGGAVLWHLGSCSLEMSVLAEFPAEHRSPLWGGSARVCRPSSQGCWVLLPQGMCWAGVCCRNSPCAPWLLTLLWPQWIYQGLSRVFSSPACASYTCAHPNPVPCTMMQTLIINQIIQPAFSNSCLIQSFLLSLLFDVCFHILFIAYNSSAAVNTELLIVMDFCYTYHYSVWILFNHH